MDDESPLIYGLEFQTRALTSQQCESDTICFMVGTQSLKLALNQVHLVSVNEDSKSLDTKILPHPYGEIWHIAASPTDPDVIVTTYNTLTDENVCVMRSTLWHLEEDVLSEKLSLAPEGVNYDIKQSSFHPTEGYKLLSTLDNQWAVFDVNEGKTKTVQIGVLEGRGQSRLLTAKWNPHHGVSQIVSVNDCQVRGWDLSSGTQAWCIDNAHAQLVRDLDMNPNRQYYLATCGDDGCTKFWDIRNASEPVVTRADHSHWVWTVRYNLIHDQLVLSASSDSRVKLISVSDISSDAGNAVHEEDNPKTEQLEEGVLSTFEEHEDSVYCVEWSTADPWTFASLSYDGRLVINTVSRQHKYKILL